MYYSMPSEIVFDSLMLFSIFRAQVFHSILCPAKTH